MALDYDDLIFNVVFSEHADRLLLESMIGRSKKLPTNATGILYVIMRKLLES